MYLFILSFYLVTSPLTGCATCWRSNKYIHTYIHTYIPYTGDHPPIRQAPRRIPPHLAAEVKAQICELVDQGILEESNGTWSSPIVMVRKKEWEISYGCRFETSECL